MHILWNNENIDEILKNTSLLRISDYDKSSTTVVVRCLKDNYEWRVRWFNMVRAIRKNKHPCPKCTGHMPVTNEYFDECIKNRNIKRIGNIISSHTHVKLKCLICDNIWNATPNKIMSAKHGCPECGKKKVMKIIHVSYQMI
jgi:predicted RNA-binding Zn-ribbon protein involved in translation (DUF1610 family)